ncbi:sigma 54-interacting transcriptional regulator [Aneurinibacillus sp. REN35]|uniref:sigma 54-interacting transcriptional regulator n=1 Tax=Aneurinibacillus sp. REN35 TaxID=3237286 RepID=UPI003529BA38
MKRGADGIIQGTTTIANQTIEVQSKPLFQNEQRIGSITVLKKVQTAREGTQQLTEIPAQEQAHFTRLIAGTQSMQVQIETARLFSNHEAPVCLYGERGVGKQSFAEAIHNEGSRQKQPFLVLECDLLKENQTDYGLFTVDNDTNLFAAARGGTVYLKNIGHLPVGLQDKLTRLLQIKKIEQSEQPHVAKVHPRILTSHTRDLKLEVEAGIFREDLYHLLNGGSLRVPPLRKRKEDIPELIRWFIVSYNMREGKQIVGLRPELMNRLTTEEWPGNVEQLQDAVEKICQAGNGPFIALEAVQDVLEDVFTPPPAPKPPIAATDPMETKKGTDSSKREAIQHTGQEIDIAGKTLEELETEIILRVLEEENNNQSQTAKRLGINRTTLWRKVKEATEQT